MEPTAVATTVVTATKHVAEWQRDSTAAAAVDREASGLRNNYNKCSAITIECSDLDLSMLDRELLCEVSAFPCKYLGLPLSLGKLTKADLQPMVEKIAGCLLSWTAGQLTTIGSTLVESILTSILVHLLIAINPTKWVLKGTDKVRCGFLWQGVAEAKGGHCRLAWTKVCAPKQLGGLGIHNLDLLGVALSTKWLWSLRTAPDKPWQGLPMLVLQREKDLLLASTRW
uniref:Retrotransposon protein, putative, unclassified n=2 Tax=Oryza sativa subsp. japonica TaxID=39947 RepID=A0A5S6R880_ORYSJ|nr:Hypothetical protein with similarity to putative retroelement [Oryza sativa Japonica Group]ABB47219.2 retrotransposon protein, putative, LINE subclass [Oryza sativa Japonica Group]